MRQRLTLVLAGLTVGMAAAALPAAQAPTQPRPVFRSSTEHVAVDVVVTDGNDRIVSDLTREDFTITVKGRAQTIEDFAFVSIPVGTRTIDYAAPVPVFSDIASNSTTPNASRAMVFVVDDATIRPQELLPLRKTMVEFLGTLSPDDQVAMVYVSHSDLAQDFTNDIGRLIAAVKTQKEALGAGTQTPYRDRMFVLRNAVKTLTAARQPRKAIVFVGASVCLPYSEDGLAAEECRDFIKRAKVAGVPLYTIDPRTFTDDNFNAGIGNIDAPAGSASAALNAQLDSMKAPATETGGRGFSGMSDIPRAVREIMTDNGSFYLLGFYPAPITNDGQFHEVDVRVKRPGLKVRARAGYTAASENPRSFSPARAMTAALGEGLDDPGLAVRAFVAPATPVLNGRTRTIVTVEVTYPVGDIPSRNLDDELRIGILALSPDAKIKASFQRPYELKGKWTPQARGIVVINEAIDLPSDQLTLRIGVTSRALGKTGTTHLNLTVPDLREKALQLTPPVLGTTSYALDAALGLNTIRFLVPFQPTTARTFSPSDTLRVYARALWRTDHDIVDATISVSGPTVVAPRSVPLTGTRLSNGQLEATLDVRQTLAGLAQGEYVLEIAVRHPAGSPAVRQVPFSVR
jgi:VWFA-related protein